MNTLRFAYTVRITALGVIASVLLTAVPTVHAAEEDVTFLLRPHCDVEEFDDDWIFGPIPVAGFIANTGGGRCPGYEVENPETLKTKPLNVDETLDMDIGVHNPTKQDLKRIRAWLSYDPNVLEGISIELAEREPYVVATPGEEDFDIENGYAKMELTSEAAGELDEEKMYFARVQFRVKKQTPNGTVISFHDPQPEGRTTVTAREGEEEPDVLADEPGTLHVLIRGSNTFGSSSSSSISSSDISSAGSSFSFTPLSSSSSSEALTCTTHDDCGDDLCIAGVCQADLNKIPDGGACVANNECFSGTCSAGVCVTGGTSMSSLSGTPTAFSLLQVQNVRATTETSSIFIAWDALSSSQLKAYNAYYGTTSGRYIQRRTVQGGARSLTLRNLPVGTTYYLAVRAVNASDEESAFSTEVAVTVGDPGSSTSPLDKDTLGAIGGNPLGTGGATDVPGETGLPSVLLIALLTSAVIGTAFASRRQYAAYSA